jgi:hypothetical protein
VRGKRDQTSRGRWAIASALALWATLGVGGCRFSVPGFDLASSFANDAAVGDMPPPLDLIGVPFVPSNVVPADVLLGAASLSGPTDIDTDLLLIDGAAPPSGVVFRVATQHTDWAVLSVHDLDLNANVIVHGTRTLIILAAGNASISAVVHAEAKTRTPGPGGQYTGPGNGGDGKASFFANSGGGGAGHGGPGGVGGTSTAATDNQGGLSGVVYSGALLGGSGGGDGAGANAGQLGGCAAGSTASDGGAGGGAVQISSAETLTVTTAGGVNAGGGGGSGGCHDAASAGGGGGSGGTIWLEAPVMSLLGTLASNGGGGGSAGQDVPFANAEGANGGDGAFSPIAAAGGASAGSASGAGGAGGAQGVDATAGGHNTSAGGGGGGAGFIRLRTHLGPPITASTTVMSPAATISTDF